MKTVTALFIAATLAASLVALPPVASAASAWWTIGKPYTSPTYICESYDLSPDQEYKADRDGGTSVERRDHGDSVDAWKRRARKVRRPLRSETTPKTIFSATSASRRLG